MVENEYKQRLVAILHADVVGYSRLMNADEASTVKTLEGHREAVIQTVNQHHGNIIDMAGDSVLANFSSVVSAVQCSVELQKAIETLNDQLPVDHKMQFRIGVNLGDIIVNQDAIYGDGVNVAARIQALAEPGGICISGAVYDSVAQKLPLSYKSIGEQRVKNIAAPVHVYRILSGADSTDKVFPLKPGFRKSHALLLAGSLGIVIFSLIYLNVFATRNEGVLTTIDTPILAPDYLNKPSIAVLPFENLSDEAEQEYFADGITDDIITDLTKVSGLLVISRDSSFTYKDQELDVRQLSKKLNARYILKGSVRRSGGQIRINSVLTDGRTGKHIWADRYDGNMRKVFALQDMITQKIVSALSVKLSIGERENILIPDTDNIEAYEYFLKGRDTFFRYSKNNNKKAQELYKNALELDPDFALAGSMLAWSYWYDFVNGWSSAPEQTLKSTFALAEKSISLNDALPIAYFVKGLVYREKKEYVKAQVEAEKAIELDPNYANGHVLLATILYYAGKPEESLEMIEKAMRLNPHHPHNYIFHKGQAYFILRQYDKAIEAFQHGLESQPGSDRMRIWLAAAYAQSDNIDDAEWEVEQALMSNPDVTIQFVEKAFPFKRAEDLQNFSSGLRKAGLPE